MGDITVVSFPRRHSVLGKEGEERVCEESTGAHDSKREILKNVAQRVSARKVAFKNDTRKPNTDTQAINLIEMNTRVP